MSFFNRFANYEEAVLRTVVPFKSELAVIYPAICLSGEAGEVANQVQKIFRDDGGLVTERRREKIKHEIGDVLFNVALLCRDLHITMLDCALANIHKVADRVHRDVIHGEGDDR